MTDYQKQVLMLVLAFAGAFLVTAEEIVVQLLPGDVSSMSVDNSSNAASSGYVNLNYVDSKLSYEVHVSNLEAARGVQIRLGDTEQGGVVVATLFKAAMEPTDGTASNGLIAQGVLNDYDLVGPLELPKGRSITIPQFYEWYVKPGSTFFQINTAARPQGELKGQINANAKRSSTPGSLVRPTNVTG